MHRRRLSLKLTQPEPRYQNFIIGYLRTNPNLAQKHVDDLASKVGMTSEDLVRWYKKARGNEKPPLSFYQRQTLLELKEQLGELGLLTTGYKKVLAYRLFLANSSPERLEEQQKLAKSAAKRNEYKIARRRKNVWESRFPGLSDNDVEVFQLVFQGKQKVEALCLSANIPFEGSIKDCAIALVRRKYPDWIPHHQIDEAAAEYFSHRSVPELKAKVDNLNNKHRILRFTSRSTDDLARAYARFSGFDVKFDLSFLLLTVKLLSRIEKEILVECFPELNFKVNQDKLLMAHRIVETRFEEYDRSIIHAQDFYRNSFRDPESVLCKIYDLGLEFDPDCNFIDAVQLLADKLDVRCENQDGVLEYELHAMVQWLRSGRGKLRPMLLKFYSEMTDSPMEGNSTEYFTRMVRGLGRPNFEAAPANYSELIPMELLEHQEEEHDEDVEHETKAFQGSVIALPRESVVDVQADGPINVGRIATIGTHEFEVMSCVSEENNIYRCIAFEKMREEISIDDPVSFKNHPFLHPRLYDVKGKTVTSLGRVVEEDLFNETKPPQRIIRAQTMLKDEVKSNRLYCDSMATQIIPTNTPTIDCLYPMVHHGVHVVVSTRNVILRNWVESFTMRCARARPVVFGRFYPSEETLMQLGPQLRREETNDITIACSLYSDTPLAKWHTVTTSVSFAAQDPESVLILPNGNHINQAINSLYSSMGGAAHPKLFSSHLGHVPLRIRLGEKTIKPTSCTNFPGIYGITNSRKFTSVIGVTLDELELPYAYSMFDWASSVWVLREDEYTGRSFVCPYVSGSRSIEKERVSSPILPKVLRCRERWELGAQLQGIKEAEYTRTNDLQLKPEHEAFLDSVYKPMAEFFEQDEMRDALDIISSLSADSDQTANLISDSWTGIGLGLAKETSGTSSDSDSDSDSESSSSDNEAESWSALSDEKETIYRNDLDSDDFRIDEDFESDEFLEID